MWHLTANSELKTIIQLGILSQIIICRVYIISLLFRVDCSNVTEGNTNGISFCMCYSQNEKPGIRGEYLKVKAFSVSPWFDQALLEMAG